MNKKIFHSVHAFAKKLGKAAIFVAFVGIAFFAGAHNGNLSGIPQAHADTNIQLSDTFTGAKFVTGATSSFSIFVANTSTVSSMNVNASDTLPTGLTFVSATSSISGMTFSTTTNATGTQVVSWGSFNIDPQSTTTITLTVAVTGSPACGLQNTVNVDEFVNENNGSSHSHSQVNEGPACTVLPAANLSIAKTVNGTSTIVSGNPVTYTITVKALGPATSTGVTATDAWSSTGLTYVTSTPSLGTYASSTGLWKINDMASGTVATLNITGMTPSVTATTTITNWATVCESASSTNTNASTTASSTITVTPTIADLSMGKTADATTSTVNVARTVNYLLTVKAFGPATSTDVVATDTLPAGVTYVTSTPSEGTTTFSAGTLTWNIPDMVPGTIATTSVQTTVDATSTGPLTNWATVTESPLLTNTSTSTASSTITVENPACTSGCASTSTLVIDVRGLLDGATSTVTVDDNGTSTDIMNVTSSASAILSLGDAYAITATTTSAGYTVATSSDCTGSFSSSTGVCTITFTPHIANLLITKSTVGNISTTTSSSTVTYVLTATASGPATSTNVTVTDNLPQYLEFVTSTPSEGTTTFTASTTTSGTLIWTIPDMASGTIATTSVETIVSSSTPPDTVLTNWATVTEDETNTSTSTASSTITVNPTCTGSSCGGASKGTLAINVQGLLNGATSTVIVSESGATLATIPLGDGATSTVLTVGDAYAVTATTTAAGYPTPTLSGCSGSNFSAGATCTITFVPDADLSMGKTADATTSTVNVARTVNYLLTVKAFGPATSTDVVATDTLPAGVTYVTSTPSEGTTTFSAGTLTWNIPDMVPGTIATTSVQTTVDATSTGPLTNWATVTESPLLTNTSTSTASSTITVENPATCVGGSCYDISVTKIASDPNPTGNEAITYTITVSNSGSTEADLLHVTDSLPSVLTLSATQSVTDSQGTVTNGGTLDWAVGSLVPGASATLKIPVVVNALADGTNVLNVAKTYTELLGSNVILSAATSTIAVQAAPVTPVTPSCTGNCGGGGGGGGGTATGGGGGSAYEISIDGGAATTATTSAMLSLYGTDAYQMELSNSTNFGSSTWQLYATTLPWTLTSGGGEKTVYVKYRDISKNYLGSAQDSIDLVQGQVLGASTSSCGMYLDKYIKLGADNDSFEVKKLQVFLNYDLGLNLPVTGTYDTTTYNAVEQFQLKYNIGVLSPWVPYGLVSDTTPTGYVYKTTRRMINLIMCPSLDLPMPPLSKEG